MTQVLETTAPGTQTSGRFPAHKKVTQDLVYLRTGIVNVYLYANLENSSRSWVLIDAGMPGTGHSIMQTAQEWLDAAAPPSAIILTHGHFDHVGALEALAQHWDVPVYAHRLELPYLTGKSSYPPADPTVGGGAMAALSRLYPRGPIDLGERVHPLPADGSVPGMPGWRWIHTPGHSPGHISLFRDDDRTLIAGDAFVTTKQESATAVLAQRPELHGPPMYFTPDWESARRSVERLAALEPRLVATGHGPPLEGPEMLQDLRDLARNFRAKAMPERGRYVSQPAVFDENGVVAVPPAVADPLPRVLLGVGLGLILTAALRRARRHSN